MLVLVDRAKGLLQKAFLQSSINFVLRIVLSLSGFLNPLIWHAQITKKGI